MSEPTILLSSVVTAAPEHLTADLDGEAVILGVDRGMYFGVNEVGAAIWQLLQSPRRVRDIRDELVQRYEVDEETMSADLVAVLRRMATEGMIEVRS